MELKKITIISLFMSIALVSLPTQAISWSSIVAFITTMQTEMSAWAINVKQTSLAAHQITSAEVYSKKQLATAIGAINMSDRVSKAVTSFDSELGQPMTIKCEAQKQGKLFVEAVAQRDRDSSKLMTSYSSQRVGSRAEADFEILNIHKNTYCSIAEAKQGICELTPNGMQAWDTDYSGAFTEATLSPEGELAGYAYTAMVTDLRAEAQADCSSASCSAAQSHQLAASAFTAMSANSLVGQVVHRRVPVLD